MGHKFLAVAKKEPKKARIQKVNKMALILLGLLGFCVPTEKRRPASWRIVNCSLKRRRIRGRW